MSDKMWIVRGNFVSEYEAVEYNEPEDWVKYKHLSGPDILTEVGGEEELDENDLVMHAAEDVCKEVGHDEEVGEGGYGPDHMKCKRCGETTWEAS